MYEPGDFVYKNAHLMITANPLQPGQPPVYEDPMSVCTAHILIWVLVCPVVITSAHAILLSTLSPSPGHCIQLGVIMLSVMHSVYLCVGRCAGAPTSFLSLYLLGQIAFSFPPNTIAKMCASSPYTLALDGI